jgi:hypothetical protein
LGTADQGRLDCRPGYITVGIVLYLSGVYFQPWALILMTLLLPMYIAAGTWWYGKHVLRGRTTYPKALLVGVVINVITGLAYITYNVVSITFVYAHFLDNMTQAEFARAAAGMDAASAGRLHDTPAWRDRQPRGRELVAVCRMGAAFVPIARSSSAGAAALSRPR